MNIYDNYETNLRGIYKDSLIGFIKQKQALGLDFKSQIWMLSSFDSFTLKFNNYSAEELPRELVEKWVFESSSSYERKRRYGLLIRQFAEYMVAGGKSAYLFPKRYFTAPQKYMPYIFTKDQIQNLFVQAEKDAKLHQNINSRRDTAIILKLLYGCGLRISEATNLKVCDVNFGDGVLRIMEGKFDKDRLVPMSKSVAKYFEENTKSLFNRKKPNDYLFSADDINPYSNSAIYTRFRNLLFDAGIPHKGKGYGPRMHDLRHTFAVHSLRQLDQSGMDLYTGLPILSAYLGHRSVSSTQWYLHLTAEVYPDMMATVNANFGDVYREVCYD